MEEKQRFTYHYCVEWISKNGRPWKRDGVLRVGYRVSVEGYGDFKEIMLSEIDLPEKDMPNSSRGLTVISLSLI